MAETVAGRDRREEIEEEDLPPEMDVREEDLEPHQGLRYIARLFKILAILILLLLIGEIVYGLINEGTKVIPSLMVQVTPEIVFVALLWAGGDLALMLIESNHDLRATRILVGRLNGKVGRLERAYVRQTGQPLPGAGAQAGRSVAGAGSVERETPGPSEERPPSHREG